MLPHLFFFLLSFDIDLNILKKHQLISYERKGPQAALGEV